MRIPRQIHEQLLAHAREDAPNECCGLVGGRDGELTTYYRVRNAEASPLRYMLDPSEQLRTNNEMEERELLAAQLLANESRDRVDVALAECRAEAGHDGTFAGDAEVKKRIAELKHQFDEVQKSALWEEIKTRRDLIVQLGDLLAAREHLGGGLLTPGQLRR